jgi:hypothetical protein
MLIKQQYKRPTLTIAIILFWSAWAVVYIYEAVSDPFGGDETTLFIQPLFYLLIAVGVWAGIEALFDRPGNRQSQTAASFEDHDAFGATGLADYRRLILVVSLPLMLVLIGLFGFVISAVLYVTVIAFGLGERRRSILAMMAFLATTVVWLFFETLLGVPLTLWPPAFS